MITTIYSDSQYPLMIETDWIIRASFKPLKEVNRELRNYFCPSLVAGAMVPFPATTGVSVILMFMT